VQRQATMASEQTKGTNKAEAKNGAGELAEVGNIDKIRDILFGAQSRDTEKRIVRLEERFTKEAGALREDLHKRFEILENYIKKEIDALTERLKVEQVERTDGLKEITKEIKETTKSFEKKISQMDEQSAKSQRELRQQILEQAKALTDDLKQKHDIITAGVARSVQELQNDKTDRTALADLFTEISVRLQNNFRLPGD
jgi:DNA anti-recombination protein RmuC